MNFYKLISIFYDKFFSWNFQDYSLFLEDNILNNYQKNNLKILDIACWTWWIFPYFIDKYKIDWLDFSKEMLLEAKIKFPKSNFYLKDMTDFLLEEKYDVAFCLFDSINHLDSLLKWEKVFKNIYNSLVNDWILFFDCNTLQKLSSFDSKNNFIAKNKNDYIILNRKSILPNKAIWNLKSYKFQWSSSYFLEEAFIEESSFYLKEINNILVKYFKNIEYYDMSNLKDISKINKLDKKIDRIWFLCFK